jgi:hypothetical protein
VINEPDFLPLHVVRILAQAATPVRAQRGKLVATPLGKSMLSDERQGSLPAILFHLAFWHTDVGYFGRGLLGSWPQAHIGVVLWSLSVSAGDWQTGEKLTRLCTIPEPATLTGTWDRSAYAMEARILRTAGVSQRKHPRQVRSAALLSQVCTLRSPAHIRRKNEFCAGCSSLTAACCGDWLAFASDTMTVLKYKSD